MNEFLKMLIVAIGMILIGSIAFTILLGFNIGLFVFLIVSCYASLFVGGLYIMDRWGTK